MPQLEWSGDAAAAKFRVISGGQAGVDRGALDAALQFGLPTNGFCPKGRKSEDGRIPDKYVLQELPTEDYPPRTRANVKASDGTLIVVRKKKFGLGTRLTQRCAMESHKPLFIVQLQLDTDPAPVVRWMQEQKIETLNIAGPRESSDPGIQASAEEFLSAFFQELLNQGQRE